MRIRPYLKYEHFGTNIDVFRLQFYRLAADNQEYCFTKYLKMFFFLTFTFEPRQFFLQIPIKNSWGFQTNFKHFVSF